MLFRSALRALPPPSTVSDLQRWLGAVNYYSAFIPHYADITAPLSDLLKGHPDRSRKKSMTKLLWSSQHQAAFEQIRQALAAPPLLRLFDPALPCIVSADASRVAIGGVLEQEEHGVRRPVAYYSRKLSPAEQRYTTRERECLAVKQCLQVWRHYLLGAPFTVRSDHQSLEWLQSQKVETLSDRLLRWVEFFSLFDFKQQYIPGVDNVLPDQLSRPATEVVVGAEDQRRELDLMAIATLLQEQSGVTLSPAPADVDEVDMHGLQASLATDLRAAQRADAELSAIIARMESANYNPLADQFRPLYELCDHLLVVPELDGRKRVEIGRAHV